MGASIIQAAPIEPRRSFSLWFREHVAGTLLTMIVGTAFGAIGSWYTIQDKVADQEKRLLVLEASVARKEEVRVVLEAVMKQNDSIDRRLSNIENTLMAERK